MKRDTVLRVVVFGLLGILCSAVYILTNNLEYVAEILINFGVPFTIMLPLVKVARDITPNLFAGSVGTLIDLDHAVFDIIALYGIKFEFIQPGRPITHSFLFVCIVIVCFYIWETWRTRKIKNPIVEDYILSIAIFSTGIGLMSHLLTDSLTEDPIIYWPITQFIVLSRFSEIHYVFGIFFLLFLSWLFAMLVKKSQRH